MGEAGVSNGPITPEAGSRSDSERHLGSVIHTGGEESVVAAETDSQGELDLDVGVDEVLESD